jgi:multicomponent Na+:H+ antiporter subunit G
LSEIEIGRIAIAFLILLGACFNLLGAFGIIRLPDVYTRSHAATKSATLGVICILSGAFVFFWLEEGHISARLLLGLIFVFITAPVAGHLICRAAYRTGVPLWEKSIQDDLKVRLNEEDFREKEN